MANIFKSRYILLNKALVDTTGNSLYINGQLAGTGVFQLTGDYASNAGLVATGSAAITYTNSVGSILSGNLTQTGITLFSQSNSIGQTLSGNLTLTGAALSAVKVTGSNVINVANFTGLGGTLIIYSGNQIFISGASATVSGGSGGTGVSQGQLDSLSGYVEGIFVHRTGEELISGIKSFTTGMYVSGSFIQGNGNITIGLYSHAEGYKTITSGGYSHAEGDTTKASGYASHAEGTNALSIGYASHAEGQYTTAYGNASHAEGWQTIASGDYGAHAEGQETVAVQDGTHAEGILSIAYSYGSHAEGNSTISKAYYSHSEGQSTITSGRASHAQGYNTVTQADFSLAAGLYNRIGASGLFQIGRGTASDRNDAIFVHYDTSGWNKLSGNWETQTGFLVGGNPVLTGLIGGTGIAVTNNSDGTFTINSTTSGGGGITLAQLNSLSGYSDSTFVRLTGNDYISGEKVFNSRTIFSGNSSIQIGEFTNSSGSTSSFVGGSVSSGGLSGNFVYGQRASAGTLTAFGVTGSQNGNFYLNPILGNVTGAFRTGFNIYAGFSAKLGLSYVTQTFSINGAYFDGNSTVVTSLDPIATSINWTYGSQYDAYIFSTATFIGSNFVSYINSGNIKIGHYARAFGVQTYAGGYASEVKGYQAHAIGDYSSAQGLTTESYGAFSNAEGESTRAIGYASHAEGLYTSSIGNDSHAEGESSTAFATASHVEGYLTRAYGNSSHAEGDTTKASGYASHAEGTNALSIGYASHAEGSYTIASGDFSHAEGDSSEARGRTSHAEGYFTITTGRYSHSEGYMTITSGNSSHAEGYKNSTLGNNSHAEGSGTLSIGASSHAEGERTIAFGRASHAQGNNTIAESDYSLAAGQYNRTGVSGLFQVGRGTSTSNLVDIIYVSDTSTNNSILSGEWITSTTGQDNQSLINYFRLTGASGALQAQIAGGGSQVKVTGSSNIAIANFTGLGGTEVIYSNGIIFISGSAGSSASNSDGINLSGNLTATGQQVILISGNQNIYNTKTFKGSGHIEVDVDMVALPNNPFMVAGSGDYYLQANFVNKATGLASSTDIVLTVSDGTDTSGYLDIGVNNPGYNQGEFNLSSGRDGFIQINGGNLVIGTNTNHRVVFHTDGGTLDNFRMAIDDTGILLPATGKIRIGDYQTGSWMDSDSIHFGISEISGVGINRKSILSISDTGWGNTYFQPAPWNKAIKYFGPNNAATQTLYGDTAANVGTLAYTTSEVLSDYTQVTPAAGASAGLAATNASYYRGSTVGNNGFFFTCKFILNTAWGTSGLATSSYGAPSGCRIFVGLTDQAVATQVGINEPIGNMIGLNYMWASGGVAANTGAYMQNWAIRTRDNVVTSTGTTAMVFQTGYYRFSMNCEPFPNNNFVTWELVDLLRKSGVNGQVTANLPVGSTALRPMVALGFVSGIKVIGSSMLYAEKPVSPIG